MPFMFPMRTNRRRLLANTPGRLTEVPWLARMPLSGGLVSAVSSAPLIGRQA